MSDKLLTRDQAAARAGMSIATFYRRIEDGSFPPPIHPTPGTSRWRLSDVRAWEAGASDSTPPWSPASRSGDDSRRQLAGMIAAAMFTHKECGEMTAQEVARYAVARADALIEELSR